MKRALDYLGWFTGAVGTLCIRYANNVLVICPAIALGLGLVGALVGIGVGLSMERTTGVADLNPLVGLSVRLGLVRWGDWWGHFAEGWWLLFVLAPWLPAITTAAWFSFGVAQMANGHLNQGLGHALAAAVAFVVFSMVALVAARAWALLGRLFAAAGSVMTSVSGTQPVDERPDAGRGKTQRAPSGESSEASVEQAIAYAVQTPRLDYSSMSGMQPLKEELLKAGREALAPGLQSRNGVLLFGRPGNGKTAMAEALAGELRVRFLSISIADLQSMWTGETTQRLVQVFRDARRQAPCVLLIDEIDSIISRRSGAGSDQEAGRTTNAFLTEVVKARGTGVLVIAATNFLESLDTAAVREGRFDWKIEVPVPDLDARIGLIMGTVASGHPSLQLSEVEARAVALRWNGFSVARCKAIAIEAASAARSKGRAVVQRADLLEALKRVQVRSSQEKGPPLPLDGLGLAGSSTKALAGLGWRMEEVFEAEALGAAIPNALMLTGPNQEVLKQTATALAARAGWLLMEPSHADLSKPDGFIQLHERAKEARPVVVLLRDLESLLGAASNPFQSTAGVVRELEAAIQAQTTDVLWVVAVEDPGSIDQRLLQASGLIELIHLIPSGRGASVATARSWLAAKGWSLEASDEFCGHHFNGCSATEVQRVFQLALNRLVDEGRSESRPIERSLTEQALLAALESRRPSGVS